MRRRSCLGRSLKFLLLATLLIALGPSIVNLPRAWVACRVWDAPPPAEPASGDPVIREAVRDIPDYYRPEDKTYLTLPEWYIVYSTDEYGAFLQQHRSSDFPYFAAVNQYWESYREACGTVRGIYPFNGDSQFTLAFIGISFTAENMLKGAYEKTLGRMAQWTAPQPTEEEIYAAQVAQEYGEFMHMTPWYFFPFKEKLRGLWQETSLWGPNPIRKWERKLALTLEYGGKIVYGGFTNLGAQATYGGTDVEKIYAVTTGLSEEMLNNDLELVETMDNERQLIRITRFEYFSDALPGLIERGVEFVEIAGNDDILFTLLGPEDADDDFEHGTYLFDLPILTQPGLTRLAVNVRVADIEAFLEELESRPDIQFEHMYDY